MPSAKPEISLTLTWVQDSAKSTVFLTPQIRSVPLGRNPDGVCLNDEFVSRIHAIVYRAPDGLLRVRDNNSSNGTYLNGIRIKDAPVQLGDELRIGHTTLRFTSAPSPGADFLRGWPNHWSCIPKQSQQQFATHHKTKPN